MNFTKNSRETVMLTKLFTYLKHEQQLLKQLVNLAEKQQKALINFNATELEKVTAMQEEISKSIETAEEYRIRLLITTFNLSRKEALKLKLSSIASIMDQDEKAVLQSMKDSIRDLIIRLHTLNKLNRTLAIRARNYVKEALGVLTNGTNQVCNVKI
jgi:hypothetical protein